MLRIFAATCIPYVALARGTGDGSSSRDAAEVELIPGVLKLFTYN